MNSLFGGKPPQTTSQLRTFRRQYHKFIDDWDWRNKCSGRSSIRIKEAQMQERVVHLQCVCGAISEVPLVDYALRLQTDMGCCSAGCTAFEAADVWRHPLPAIELQAALLAFTRLREFDPSGLKTVAQVRREIEATMGLLADVGRGMWVFKYENNHITLNERGRSIIFRTAQDEILTDHTGSSVRLSDVVLLHDASVIDVLRVMTSSNTVQEISTMDIKIHNKDSALAKVFEKPVMRGFGKRTEMYNQVMVTYNAADVGSVIEVDFPGDYQMSNLRKILVGRKLRDKVDFELHRKVSDDQGRILDKEDQSVLIKKCSEVAGDIVRG